MFLKFHVYAIASGFHVVYLCFVKVNDCNWEKLKLDTNAVPANFYPITSGTACHNLSYKSVDYKGNSNQKSFRFLDARQTNVLLINFQIHRLKMTPSLTRILFAMAHLSRIAKFRQSRKLCQSKIRN